jgi:signal peptidase
LPVDDAEEMSALPHAHVRPLSPRRVLSAITHAALTGVCVVAVAILFWALASQPLGYRILIDYSDSMRPAIAAGDVLVTKVARPAAVGPGDIVTFQDPYRKGRLLTHRIVSRRRAPGTGWSFVTRGDANTGVERWNIRDDGQVGRLTGRVPRAGLALAWLRDGNKRVIALLVSALALTLLLARLVWRL